VSNVFTQSIALVEIPWYDTFVPKTPWHSRSEAMKVEKFYMTATAIRKTNAVGHKQLAELRRQRQERLADVKGNAFAALQVTEKFLSTPVEPNLLLGRA
jgi:hypothetical protein